MCVRACVCGWLGPCIVQLCLSSYRMQQLSSTRCLERNPSGFSRMQWLFQKKKKKRYVCVCVWGGAARHSAERECQWTGEDKRRLQSQRRWDPLIQVLTGEKMKDGGGGE